MPKKLLFIDDNVKTLLDMVKSKFDVNTIDIMPEEFATFPFGKYDIDQYAAIFIDWYVDGNDGRKNPGDVVMDINTIPDRIGGRTIYSYLSLRNYKGKIKILTSADFDEGCDKFWLYDNLAKNTRFIRIEDFKSRTKSKDSTKKFFKEIL